MHNFSHTIIILFYYTYCAATLLTYTQKVDGAILNDLEKSLSSSLSSDLREPSTTSNQLEPEQTMGEASEAAAVTTRWASPRTLFVAELSALKAVALLTFPLLVPVLFAAAAVLILPLQLFSLSSPLNVIGKRIHQQQPQPHHEFLGSNIFRTRPTVIRKVPTTRQPSAGLYAGLS